MPMKTNPTATFQPARSTINGLSGETYQTTIHAKPMTNMATITGASHRELPIFTGAFLSSDFLVVDSGGGV